MLSSLNWIHTSDGFSLCTMPLADILERMGIHDTGLSDLNPADVQSYYDDWHLYTVTGTEKVYSLIKMREQEHDFVPGYSDRDNPGVTISFVPFRISVLEKLETNENRSSTLRDFVAEFRCVTELPGQHHSPALQKYFSRPDAQAPYLVAECYVKKLLLGAADGFLPLPDRMRTAPKRVLEHIQTLNARAGRTICDIQSGRITILDPANPTPEEQCCLLITHTGDPDFNCFAAEVKYHADALVTWQNKIPYWGKKNWYSAALRADMQLEPDAWLRKTFFAPYFDRESKIVRQQAAIHGQK